MNILIIEDDAAIAELEKTYLEFYGCTVSLCDNGEEGLERFEKGDFNMVVVDIMLPGAFDGLEFCRRLRRFSDVPLMVVSAKADDADKIGALGLGIDDYLTKPFNPGELVARVKAHIGRYENLTKKERGGEEHELTEIRDIVIDRGAHRVVIRGREAYFTDKEYQLLLYFVDHPDIVLTRERLFDRIWGYEAFGDISTVTVHVKKIRDKLEKDLIGETFPYIETIWGVGYRFRSERGSVAATPSFPKG